MGWLSSKKVKPAPVVERMRPLALNCMVSDDAAKASILSLGVKAVRITLYWQTAIQDSSHVSDVAAQLSFFHRNNIRTLVNVHQQADSTRDLPNERVYEQFAYFVANWASHWPGRAWQLWNEADVSTHTKLFTEVTSGEWDVQQAAGERYARQLEIAYPLIKRADPTCTIVTTGAQLHPYAFFLPTLLTRYSQQLCDVVAVHAYGRPLYQSAIDNVLAVKRLWRGPVWVTETGVETTDDAEQANEFRNLATQVPGADAQVPGADELFTFVHVNPDLPAYSILNTATYEERAAAKVVRESNR
jgi:hypothetical protein